MPEVSPPASRPQPEGRLMETAGIEARPSESRLRLAFLERAPASFEALYREHFRFVWRSVRRLGVHSAFVDDVVQDVFLVVHRRLRQFEGRSSTKTWLYGIVRRVISDHRRTLRRKPCFGDAELPQGSASAPPSEDGPHESLERSERVRLLYRVLAELDEDKRETFVLSEFEQMTVAEIAEALDANPNTISSRLRAARQKFDEALERLSSGEGSAS